MSANGAACSCCRGGPADGAACGEAAQPMVLPAERISHPVIGPVIISVL